MYYDVWDRTRASEGRWGLAINRRKDANESEPSMTHDLFISTLYRQYQMQSSRRFVTPYH